MISISRKRLWARLVRARRFRPPDCLVEEKKIVDYLLNPEHPKGGPKAKFFLAGGFDRTRPEIMIRALQRHFRQNKNSAEVEHDKFGCDVLVIKGPMENPDGRRPIVVSVWRKDSAQEPPRLVTAYSD